jgi:hypothetical protein
MATSLPEPAKRLVELLETLPQQERQEITTWLLKLGHPRPTAPTGFGVAWASEPGLHVHPTDPGSRVQRLTSALPAGEDSQLVTLRLPADRHAELRTWCTDHGFTMAAVIRGLVERFLEQQGPHVPSEESALGA